MQVGQIVKQLADHQESEFSTNTQVNTKEHCKSITTREGIVIENGIGDNLSEEKENRKKGNNKSEWKWREKRVEWKNRVEQWMWKREKGKYM